MKKTLLFTVFVLTIYGCKSYVQVYETNSTLLTNSTGLYIFENDSLKITYSFWEEKGLMTFSIFNKMEKPLYIDWKKSSYIDNSVKLNYWVDRNSTNIQSNYVSYYYNGPLIKPGFTLSNTDASSFSTSVKEERITFIPPTSYYYRSQFYIIPTDFLKLDTKVKFEEVSRKDNLKKKTKVYKATFSKDKSPLVFRNFLTFSLSENFETEFYVDNEFYIRKVLEMDKRHFEQYRYVKTKKNKRYIFFSDFKKPNSFYLDIPKKESVNRRKQKLSSFL